MAVEDVVAADLVFRRALGNRRRNGADVMNETTTASEKAQWIPIVLGILVLFVVLAVGAVIFTVSLFRQNMSITR